MTARPRVVGGLFIDAGEGREIKAGPRAGEIRWARPPRARYECLACRWASETVTGAEPVKAFVSHIRTTHRNTCTGTPQADAA
ncbi:hypothetical protein [Streptomyces sp. NPDC002467]|uniref:hypothetical protein n=1 Tax=Streptomyces sp. NPDC002467 TaxID=3364647 RepID=UPI0036BBA711